MIGTETIGIKNNAADSNDQYASLNNSQSATACSAQPRWLFWAIGVIVLLAIGLRLKAGYPAAGLWADELTWITRIKQGFKAGIRAQGYILLHSAYFKLFGTHVEHQIRFFSIVSGLAFVPLFSLLVHRLFARPWLTVVGTALVAINVAAIAFTHEFKPYAIDLLFHTAWLCSLIAITDRSRAVLVSTVILIVGVFLSYSMVPIIAFQFCYIGYWLLKKRLALSHVVFPGLLLLSYSTYFILIYPSLYGTNSDLWSSKYGVFYSADLHGSGVFNYLSWFFGKVSAYITLPLNWFIELPLAARTRGFLAGHGFAEVPALGLLSIVLMGIKLRYIKIEDPRLTPILLLCGYTLAGVLKLFPLGYFRSNLFILCYSTLTLLIFIEPIGKLSRRWFVISLLALFIPTAVFTMRAPLAKKYFYSLPIASILRSACLKSAEAPVTIIADGKVGAALSFYRSKHIVAECKNKLHVMKYRKLDELASFVSAAKYAHVFFVGSTRRSVSDVIAVLSQSEKAKFVAEGGGAMHYIVGQGQK